MRAHILLLLALTLLTGCFEKSPATDNRLKVATTFTIIADMAQNVAGEHAEVISITKAGAEIHDYQPTPKDIAKAKDADLILYNGLNLERWFERFLRDIEGVPHIVVTKGITPISIYEGPYDGKPNPHAWMSTQNAVLYVENIRKALSDLDPANAAAYAANAAAYSEKIEALETEIKNALSHVPKDKRTLVTSEGAFSYLARDLGFEELYVWPINADQQGSPQQMRKIIDAVRERKIPVVFSESTISPKPAQQIAKETGAHYGGVLYVDSLSRAGGPVPTYLDLLRVTTSTIAEGFKDAETQ